MDVIASKTSGQNTIENYRQMVAESDFYFENMIKRIDAIDIGSGLNCAQKLDAIASIQQECEKDGLQKLNDLKQNAQKAIEIINNLDAQQVEEKLKSSDRKYNDLTKRIARKSQMIAATNKGIQSVQNEIEQIDKWLDQKIASLQEPQMFSADSANLHLQKLKAISKDADVKKVQADMVKRRVTNMQSDLEPLEKSQLEGCIRDIGRKLTELPDLITSEMDKTTVIIRQMKQFEIDTDKLKAWLRSKFAELRKQLNTIPLDSKIVENDIQMAKTIDTENGEIGTELLTELQKQAQNILKYCSDKQSLEPSLESLNNEFSELKTESASILKNMNDAFEARNAFENDVSKVENWFNEMEINAQTDIQIKSLPILEEQLQEFEKLKQQKEVMRPILNSLNERSKRILPTLNNVDKMKLHEQLKTIKDKFNKPTIADKIKTIEDYIKKYKINKDKLAQCMEILEKIQQEIRDLNKPIGIDAEDVKAVIISYERIIRDLNENKNRVNAIQIENSPELPGLLSKHNELLAAVEQQISGLRQSQTVREQYAALINQIEALIGTIAIQIAEIERSDKPLEEKLNHYDDLTSKIQECEGILASAQDRGQKIAEEGTISEYNAITENHQNIKQKLQNLQQQVKCQRQKHENIMAEQNKVVSELAALLVWLHNNETSCKSRPLLERDPDLLQRETTKHDMMAQEVQKRLDQVQNIHEQIEVDGSTPVSLVDMLSEGKSFIVNLPNELSDRKKYLIKSKQHRIDYIKYINEFKDWVHQAGEHLENCKHGVDFKNIDSDIDKFNAFFENDRPIRDLLSQKIQPIVDQIWPTLHTTEQNELSEEVRQYKKLLEKTLQSAKQQRVEFDKYQKDWNSYQDMFNSLRNALENSKIETSIADSLSGVQTNIETVSKVLLELRVSIFILMFMVFKQNN